MNAALKIVKNNLPTDFRNEAIAFLGRSSFESRSFSAYSELSDCDFVYTHFFVSKEETEESISFREKQKLDRSATSILDTSNPLKSRETICVELEKILQIPPPFTLVIDSTTFRREELLILLKELSKFEAKFLDKTMFLYSAASSMGKWLSNNVKQIRPVIGYPGDIGSRKNTHLILLLGIERHRALATIDAYEPSNISLGITLEKDSISKDIYQRNLELKDYLLAHHENMPSVFEFNPKSPKSINKTLNKQLKKYPSHNTIIAPLNTKLSTLSCGAFAISNPFVQLCYAEVEVYNAGNYSKPGSDIFALSYNSLF